MSGHNTAGEWRESGQWNTGGVGEQIQTAANLVKAATELHEKELRFSDDAEREIATLTSAVREILNLTSRAFQQNDLELASSAEPLRQVISKLIRTVKRNHTVRWQSGDCTTELGFILSDILTAYERVAGHCSNIAVAVIEIRHGTFDTHEYLAGIRNQDEEYSRKYKLYLEQFSMEA